MRPPVYGQYWMGVGAQRCHVNVLQAGSIFAYIYIYIFLSDLYTLQAKRKNPAGPGGLARIQVQGVHNMSHLLRTPADDGFDGYCQMICGRLVRRALNLSCCLWCVCWNDNQRVSDTHKMWS